MKKKLLALVLSACCVALAFALVGCGSSSSQSQSSSSSSDSMQMDEKSYSTIKTIYGEEVSSEPTGVKNILVIGDDDWETYTPGHADMMCLLRVDFDNSTITEVSIPRDTRWQFEDGTFGKLNYVYTNNGGGEAGSVAQALAAAEVIGEPIDYYVTIGFDGLEKIVDHFGGVWANLPYAIEYSFYTKDYPNEVFEAGEQTLDSWRAMAISRARTGYSDAGVQEPDLVRQYVDRMMLMQLMKNAYDNSEGIEALFTLLQSSISTNIPADVQINWAETLGANGSVTVKGTTGPFFGDIDEEAGGQWLVLADPEGWQALMAAVNSNAGSDQIAATARASFANPNFSSEIPPCTETVITVK